MMTAGAILTGLFFGGVFYIIFGFYQEKKCIINQIKHIQQQRKQQQEVKRRQQEVEEAFNKKWKRLEVKEK